VESGLDEAGLAPLLELARQSTVNYGQRLIWYTPTQYCNFDPMALELGVKGCTAALYNMCVEPDGSVLPCQSYYRPLGNLLANPWEAIWNHELAVRCVRKLVMDKCHSLLLAECGGMSIISPGKTDIEVFMTAFLILSTAVFPIHPIPAGCTTTSHHPMTANYPHLCMDAHGSGVLSPRCYHPD
jgi:radical SAM protein with 4Fe4S-binding SPASM domain